MSLPGDEDDPFWTVQLIRDTGTTPFASEAPKTDYEDHALPLGTELTDEALAGVLGCECEVSIPMNADLYDNCNEVDGRLGQARLLLKLRQVNGGGVMSGVGGDVWCAALLLSAWLLYNPEVVRGLSVLELGSGLGLCGIAAGYLAKNVTLTDYVDELLVNLHHNVEANRTPRVAVTHHSHASLEPPSATSEAADVGVAEQSQPRPQPRPQQQQTLEGARHTRSADAVPVPAFSSRHHANSNSSSNSDLPDRAYQGSGGRHALEELQQQREDSPLVHLHVGRACDVGSSSSAGASRTDASRKATRLHPLSRVRVCKLDWTAYAGDGVVARGSSREVEGDWWDDRGPDAGRSSGTPTQAELTGSGSLRCDVAVGSALIYSPHHACVADVLSRAFAEGGCNAAYVVQLSTRPGFDDFLRRLSLCGLCYRLEKMSAVLPAKLLDELCERAHVTVVGGPVTSTDITRVETDALAAEAANNVNFDEFVLCSVFRARGRECHDAQKSGASIAR